MYLEDEQQCQVQNRVREEEKGEIRAEESGCG